jgi:hypothetical protein
VAVPERSSSAPISPLLTKIEAHEDQVRKPEMQAALLKEKDTSCGVFVMNSLDNLVPALHSRRANVILALSSPNTPIALKMLN